MIVVKVMGGLGNQMYQYALYLRLLSEGKKAKLDITWFDEYRRKNGKDQHNGYELERIFNISADIANIEEITAAVNSRVIYEKEDLLFKREILNLNDGLLIGYWASIKYFDIIKPEIKKHFTFIKNIDSKNLEVLEDIKNTNSVSLHVRRGDYLSPYHYEALGSCITEDYYRDSIKYIKDRIENPKFFIFSDDIEWTRKNIKTNSETIFVDINKGKDSYKDMQLMSNCKNNINANSTFSWWASWLNNSKNISIHPRNRLNIPGVNNDTLELYYENDIRL